MVRQASCCAAPNSAFSDGMPADGGGIEQHLRAAQRRQARGFRIPLVPADQRRDARVARVEAAEAQVAGREVVFFEVQRVVGDVHLAVDAQQRAVGVDHQRGVVIHARRAPLEQRADDRRRPARAPGARSSRWWGREWARPGRTGRASSSRQKYCERNSSCTQTICAPRAGGFADAPLGFGQILGGIERAGHLDQADAKLGEVHAFILSGIYGDRSVHRRSSAFIGGQVGFSFAHEEPKTRIGRR